MKVSVRKISEITGFSPATVSNALNYKKGVNAETSAKIFKVDVYKRQAESLFKHALEGGAPAPPFIIESRER